MEPLKLSDVRKEFKFSIGKGLGFDWNRFVNGHYENGVVDFDVFLPTKGMNLQRELCWNLKQKQELILSILKENPIPKISIMVYRDGNGFTTTSLQVIDGKQRINAYIDFVNNKFPLESGHYYKDLGDDCKRCILLFRTTCDEASAYFGDRISDEDKIGWFEQINFAGIPQDEQHLKNLKTATK